ncbi:hypothetical protein EWM64_g8360, partial [Hericium alpestre]
MPVKRPPTSPPADQQTFNRPRLSTPPAPSLPPPPPPSAALPPSSPVPMEVDDSVSDVFTDKRPIDWVAVDKEVVNLTSVVDGYFHFTNSLKSNPSRLAVVACGFFATISKEYNRRGFNFLALEYDQFMEVVSKHPEVPDVLLSAHIDRSLGKIRELACLKGPDDSSKSGRQNDSANAMVDSAHSWIATVEAWKEAFKGKSHDDLFHHISRWVSKEEMYAPCYHFVVPMNLRDPNGQGFPPSDETLYKFFTGVPKDKTSAGERAQAFLLALFENVTKVVKKLIMDRPDVDLATSFREYMTLGQTFTQQNKNREAFYKAVVLQAKALLSTPSDVSGTKESPRRKFNMEGLDPLVSPESRADSVVEAVLSHVPKVVSSKKKKTASPPNPVIILAFDEAHTLDFGAKEPDASGEKWTMWTELRRALRICLNKKIVALFMSTTGKISTFEAPSDDDISHRVLRQELYLIPPFCNLGFDHQAPKIPPGTPWTLEQVVADGHIAKLGRPL